MFRMFCVVGIVLSLSACQSAPSLEDRPMTASEVAKAAKSKQGKTADQEKMPNPIKCQQAKIDLVEAEGTQEVGKINFAKDAVHRYCDDFQ